MSPRLLCIAAMILITRAAFPQQEPVAVVSFVRGEVNLRTEEETVPLDLFDWVESDAEIEGGREAVLRLLFQDGRQIEIDGPFSAVTRKDALEARRGEMRELDEVLPVPEIAPVLIDISSRRAAAVRVRGERLEGLFPSHPERVLAGETLLTFPPVFEATSYHVRVEDEAGTVIRSVDTSDSSIVIPAGLLRPGETYFWSVRSVDSPRTTWRGDAWFTVLTTAEAEALGKLLERVGDSDDIRSRLLAAEVEWRLGLRGPARSRIDAILNDAPDPARRSEIELVLDRWKEREQ